MAERWINIPISVELHFFVDRVHTESDAGNWQSEFVVALEEVERARFPEANCNVVGKARPGSVFLDDAFIQLMFQSVSAAAQAATTLHSMKTVRRDIVQAVRAMHPGNIREARIKVWRPISSTDPYFYPHAFELGPAEEYRLVEHDEQTAANPPPAQMRKDPVLRRSAGIYMLAAYVVAMVAAVASVWLSNKEQDKRHREVISKLSALAVPTSSNQSAASATSANKFDEASQDRTNATLEIIVRSEPQMLAAPVPQQRQSSVVPRRPAWVTSTNPEAERN